MKGMPRKRIHLPLWLSLVLVLLCSAGVSFYLIRLSPIPWDTLRQVIAWGHYLVPLLNWLPVLLCMLLALFVLGNPILAVAVPGFVFVCMGLVNQTKVSLRGDPLVHWDLQLLGEVLGIARGFGWQTIAMVAAAVLLFILCVTLLAAHIHLRPIGWHKRIAGTLACLCVMLGLNETLYSNQTVEQRLPTWGSFYNAADVHASKGNLYAFLYTWNASRGSGLDGYDAVQVRAEIDAYEKKLAGVSKKRPHIILVMGEAFSALSESDAVSFAEGQNPLQHFQSLAAEGIRGSIVVPSRGGGTADTEYDVLTARPSRFQRNAPYAYRTIVSETEAMPSLLKTLGYDTLALHPGFRWFYNRQNVYGHLGFDKIVFEDAFPEGAYRDTFISEEATFDMLLAMLAEQETARPGTPWFAFCLTIQNHAAYLDRFLPTGTYTFTPTIPMTDAERNILSNYFAGIRDADIALQRLSEYLNALAEPAILVYFGDHLPALEETLYDKLIPGADAEEESLTALTRLYETPFLIWQNDAARAQKTINMRAGRAMLPEDAAISSHALGAYVLQLLGLDTASPFFAFANEVRQAYPVVLESIAYTPEGAAVQTDAILTQYRHWAWYKAHDE